LYPIVRWDCGREVSLSENRYKRHFVGGFPVGVTDNARKVGWHNLMKSVASRQTPLLISWLVEF